MTESDLLRMPLAQLYLSHQFEWQCYAMGFRTLEDILVLSPEELLARPGFSYHWLGELSELLNKHRSLHLLQSIPGRSSGRSS